MLLYFLFFTGPVSFRIIRLFDSITRRGHLLRVVDVVDQVLHHCRRVGGLHALAVVGDDGAGGGPDNDGALLALYTSDQLPSFCGVLT